jgi:hypothetical protein
VITPVSTCLWRQADFLKFWLGHHRAGAAAHRGPAWAGRSSSDRLLGRMNASMRFLVWGITPLGAFASSALSA